MAELAVLKGAIASINARLDALERQLADDAGQA